jgi:hypothetical protein
VNFRSKSIFFGYLALIYAAGLLVMCDVVDSWGRWYSVMPYHRLQAQALLRGKFELSHDPGNLDHDLCWAGGGVQQVWGLGIPLWKTPFEALARMFREPAFPDAFSLGLFIAVMAYLVMQTWVGPAFDQNIAAERRPKRDKRRLIVALGGATLFLFFAPFINLLRYRMWIYEEVMAYTYCFGIALSCGLILLLRQFQWRRFWFLCAFAGIGALIRPTLIFYGFATVAVSGAFAIRHLSTQPKAETKPVSLLMLTRNPKLFIGLLLFVSGGVFLFLTNYYRFGNGLEFGHRLNIQGGKLLASVYSTHFDAPFAKAPLIERARELFGALFQVTHFNNFDWYVSNFFPGQAPAFRWREFSFYTYSVPYAIFIGIAWVTATWTVCKYLHSRVTGASMTQRTISPPHLSTALIIWAMLASIPLIFFYLRTPVIASRYMLDFAPAFASALIGLWGWAIENCEYSRRMDGMLLLLLFAIVGWQASEVLIGTSRTESTLSQTWKESMLQSSRPRPPVKKLPNEYKIGDLVANWNIPYNGNGWNATNGRLMCCAIIFVESPRFVELQLTQPVATHTNEICLADIRVKIGLEFLSLKSIVRTNESWVLRFGGPNEQRYQRGLQTVFLASVPEMALPKFATTPSPWTLQRVRWGP